MSSHREAPEISNDPAADNTDVYAFVSPDNPDTVTLIANFVPLQSPAGGPNFYAFGDDVVYTINVDNNGDGQPDISYIFQFTTHVRNPNTFLYNTGPIESIDSPNFNRYQTYTVTKVITGKSTTEIASGLKCPPCNVGPLSTPNYESLAAAAVHSAGGRKIFAGQRAEGFYVDLGSIFDLGNLRPFASAHNHFGLAKFPTNSPGVNATKDLNVHSIALQVPTTELVRSGKYASTSTIGIWATASRKTALLRAGRNPGAKKYEFGPLVQVSRLGMPLVNEVITPMGKKDYWNTQQPKDDSQFAACAAKPELAQLLPVLYPGVFPNLDALNKSGKTRADIVAILLTGIPAGLIPGFSNYTGPTQADMLRLNTSIKPSAKPSIYGLLGGDLAGFPNGRRVFDDVTAIELRALAGATYPLIDKNYTPDAAASAVTDGLTPDDLSSPYLDSFPYLGVPHSGYYTPSS